jgi:hypothetical protein
MNVGDQVNMMRNESRSKSSKKSEGVAAKMPSAENNAAVLAPDGWPPKEEAHAHEVLSRKEIYYRIRTILRLLDYYLWRAYAAGIQSPTRAITPTAVEADLKRLDQKLARYKRED